MKELILSNLIKTTKNILFLFKDLTKPNKVLLEASSICQLRCPLCSKKEKFKKKRVIKSGYLKFKNFKIFIDNNPYINTIELSNWGEIFLNPELKDIIQYAYSKSVDLTAGNGVNFNNVSKEVLKCLVKYKFRNLTVSIDGASNETYKIYRKGGNFDKVIENIKIINHYKRYYKTGFPVLSWQFIIFGHNENELPIAREMAKRLNMKFKPKLNAYRSFSPVKNKEFVRKESGLGVASREEFKQKYKRDYMLTCRQLWNSPQINWDGRLLGCCKNLFSDFGVNVFDSSLDECLKSEKYVYAKEMLLGNKKARSDIPCSKCLYYPRFLFQRKMRRRL